jgi:hypothetical protein
LVYGLYVCKISGSFPCIESKQHTEVIALFYIMAEAVGVVASIIIIAGLAIQCSKQLYEMIQDFRTAHKSLDNLLAEISSVQNLLKSRRNVLESIKTDSLSEHLRQCLQDFCQPGSRCTALSLPDT